MLGLPPPFSAVEDVVLGIRRLLTAWGFPESCALIFAVLALSPRPLTMGEIAGITRYGKSTVCAGLKLLERAGLVSKVKMNRRYLYQVNVDLLGVLVDRQLRMLRRVVEPLRDRLHELLGRDEIGEELRGRLRLVHRELGRLADYLRSAVKAYKREGGESC